MYRTIFILTIRDVFIYISNSHKLPYIHAKSTGMVLKALHKEILDIYIYEE